MSLTLIPTLTLTLTHTHTLTLTLTRIHTLTLSLTNLLRGGARDAPVASDRRRGAADLQP